MVEIYNEAVHDLLDEQDQRREMELQSCKGGFTVPGLSESMVESPEQIFEIMEAGFEHRAVGCHDVNAHSSRSHCLLVVNVNVSTNPHPSDQMFRSL
jgi:kinesin family protein C2/C3